MKHSHVQAAIDYHHHLGRYDLDDTSEAKVFHVLLSLLEYCDASDPKMDFDALLGDARQYLLENSP